MKVFRIAKKEFIRDLSGDGARLYGGRWNRKGSSVLYASESRSLATVEYLVHLPMSISPTDVCIAEIEIEGSFAIKTIEVESLPEDWMNYPAPLALTDIGEDWKKTGAELVLRIPSVVVRNEWNYLVNPAHPDFGQVRVVQVEEYVFDARLLRKFTKSPPTSKP